MSEIKNTFFVYINGIPCDYDETMYTEYNIDIFDIDSLNDDFNHTKDNLLIVDTKKNEARYLSINIEFIYQREKLWVYPLVVDDNQDVWNENNIPAITVVESGETVDLFRDIVKFNTNIEFVTKTLDKLAVDIVNEMRTRVASIIP